MQSESLIQNYYDAFNQQNWDGMLSLVSDDVMHDINQGGRETGKQAFADFLKVMDAHYEEQVRDLVVMCTPDGTRGAAEFRIEGRYKKSQAGLPEARGQSYDLPVGAFFEIKNSLITRVSNFYNLELWMSLVK